MDMEQFHHLGDQVLLRCANSDKMEFYATASSHAGAQTLCMLLNYGLKYVNEHAMDQSVPKQES